MPTYNKISQTFSEGLGHHALLIKADQGLGAESLFDALTKRIMCQTLDNAPCGNCHACHLMIAQSHPDFHVLASQEGKDIGVDQVRAINEVVSQHAQQNGNKLVYIQDADVLRKRRLMLCSKLWRSRVRTRISYCKQSLPLRC